MEKEIFVKLNKSIESDYLSIEGMSYDIKEDFEESKEAYEKYAKVPYYYTFEEYRKEWLPIEVTYDGRQKSIYKDDVLKSLDKQGYATKVAESMFGGFYLATEKLDNTLPFNVYKKKKEFYKSKK